MTYDKNHIARDYHTAPTRPTASAAPPPGEDANDPSVKKKASGDGDVIIDEGALIVAVDWRGRAADEAAGGS